MNHPTLEDALMLATTLHKGQKDKIGVQYVLHLVRVMLKGKTEKEQIVRVLHDSLEDGGMTPEILRRMGYSEDIIEALTYLTKRPEEEDDYERFIQRVGTGPELAIRAKLDDLADNMDPSRRTADSPSTRKRMAKYELAVGYLTEVLENRKKAKSPEG